MLRFLKQFALIRVILKIEKITLECMDRSIVLMEALITDGGDFFKAMIVKGADDMVLAVFIYDLV